MDEQSLERFESFYIPEPNSGCWIWIGAITTGKLDYGNFSLGGMNYRAHRVSYEHEIGKIPQGLVLDHLCRNTLCVNPVHLEPVTQRVNRERGGLGRFKFSCDGGHPRSEENTYTNNRGNQVCRICRRIRNKEWKKRRKEARGKTRSPSQI